MYDVGLLQLFEIEYGDPYPDGCPLSRYISDGGTIGAYMAIYILCG